MGTISSGVGLISGINSKDIIDKLMQIEARPQQLIVQRNTVLTSQQVAFNDISAKLLLLKLSSGGFTSNKTFQTNSATSSNEDAATVTASASATPGSYNFSVGRLVSTQQVITRGYADATSTKVGAGDITFEFGDARLSTDTALSTLNGGNGVARGKIRITDSSGKVALVDLSRALTVNDVLEAINNASGVSVSATVNGDGLKLTDNAAGAGTLSVADVGTTGTATALGLTAAAVSGVVTGTQINRLGANSLLKNLNDANGVRIKGVVDDFRVTKRDGTTFAVNLDSANTLGDVINKINSASGGTVTASVNSAGTGLQLVDSTSGATAFSVAALNSSKAAADLGILGSASGGADTITGDRLVAKLNSRLVRNLRGGSGTTLGIISITNRNGVAKTVNLASAKSVSDIIDLVNSANAGVTASLNRSGNGLQLTDTTNGSASNLAVSDVTGTAAADFGLAKSVAATTIASNNLQLRYISEATTLASLNGGAGVSSGKFTITDSSGASATVDLSTGAAVTLQDVISNINSRGIQVTARINDNGDGLLLTDTGPGTNKLKVEELGGKTAADLGILGSAKTAGANLDGSFEKTVSVTADDTLTTLAEKINTAGVNINASLLNDGSAANPLRLSLLSNKPGKSGAYIVDDNGIGLQAETLVQAQDAVVFFGSSDPARALAITSASNSLNTVIPGATIKLQSTTDSPVTVAITRDDAAITKAVQKFVTDFNSVIDTLNKYDSYNDDTKQKGLLLGDSTVSRVRSGLYNLVTGRNADLKGRYNTLSQVGISIGTGAKLVFNQDKFNAAIAADRDAVEKLFTYKVTETNSVTNTTKTTAAGTGVKIDELLDSLTKATTGAVSSQIDNIDKKISDNKKAIDAYQKRLDAKRLVLQNQFAQMESAIAKMQQQSSSLGSFTGAATTSG